MHNNTPPPDPIRAARDEVVRSDVRPADAKTAAERPGDLIDRYKLLEQIGEGGMGTVWMAEQKEPVRRRVALKIIKLGMDTKQVVARFEAERQALAMMDHPHIAKVLDAGATETGRPYFVMEYIKPTFRTSREAFSGIPSLTSAVLLMDLRQSYGTLRPSIKPRRSVLCSRSMASRSRSDILKAL